MNVKKKVITIVINSIISRKNFSLDMIFYFWYGFSLVSRPLNVSVWTKMSYLDRK